MIIKKAELEAVAVKKNQYPEDTFAEIAFAGRSNVGKSSLLNLLTGRKALARVSGSPGKTRTINFYRINELFRIVDLPGYGYAKVSRDEKLRWADLMESYFKTGRDIRLVVQLLDMRHKPTQDDLDMIDFLVQTGYNFIVVLTKCDKLNKKETAQMLDLISGEVKKYGDIPVIPFSSLKGDGVSQVREQIEKAIL